MPSHLGMDWRYIPKLFLNIVPLSSLPEKSTHDMLFNGATIEEVTENAASDFSEGDWGWEDELIRVDPDALDKAKYQEENPNAIMTPWGPALAPEAVDAIIDDNPGVRSLLGLTPEEIEEIEADADAIIDAGGDNFDTIIEQGDAVAMAENLNPNEVLTGMVDEMANTPSPSDTLFLEKGSGEEEEGPWWQNWLEDSSFSPLNLFGGTAEASGDPIDLLDEDRQFLDSLLDLSPSEILFEINDAINGERLFAESATRWVQDNSEFFSSEGTNYDLGQAILSLSAGGNYEDLLKALDTNQPPTKTVQEQGKEPKQQDYVGLEVDDYAFALENADLSRRMGEVFIEAINKQRHSQYNNYTMGGILNEKQKLDRYNEAKVVFWLDRENTYGSVETIAKEFAAFLNKYWNNPEAHTEYTDRAKLIEKAQLLARFFTDPAGAQMGEEDVGDIYASYANGVFGDEAGESNRRILLRLMRSGRGFGDHPANRYVDSKMASDERWGKDWAVSFGEMVPNMPTQGPTFAEWVSGGYPASEWPGDSEDIYYGTGYPFGRPGVTMDMLRPGPVGGTDDWMITPSGRLYNPTMGIWEDKDDFSQRIARGGMVPDGAGPQDPKASLGRKFYGVGDPDPASLPPSNISAAEIAAYLAAQEAKMPWNTMPVSEEMYGEAMTQLASAKPGTSYKAYESKKAVKGIPQEQLESMPEPYNDEQRGRRDKGLPYITGRWTGGSKAKWMAKSEAEQAAIRGGDLWVSGTTFVPTKAWGKE